MVFFVGGIMIIVGITMAVIAATFIDSGYGVQASNAAESAATAGAEDAYLQLVRNSAFVYPSGYNVANATVTVTQTGSIATAISVATVSGRTRKVQAVFAVNAATRQISVVSWGDVL
jgi:6-phosphogluconolactonase (cycloisomerase 2 family)